MDTRLQHRLYLVAKRVYLFQLGWSLAVVWLVAALTGWGLLKGAEQIALPKSSVWIWLGVTAAATIVTMIMLRLRYRDLGAIAARVEREFPALNQRLITAVSLRPNAASGKFGYLQRSVISEAIRHDFTSGWHSLIPSNRMFVSWCSSLLGLLCVSGMALAMMRLPESVRNRPALVKEVAATNAPPVVLPGNASIERGSSVIVTAKFESKVPDAVWLVHNAKPGAGEVRLAMKRSLNDPIFAAYLYDVQEALQYRVEFGGERSETYQLSLYLSIPPWCELMRSLSIRVTRSWNRKQLQIRGACRLRWERS